MSLVRLIIGKIILFLNWLTFPKKGHRPEAAQKEVEAELAQLALYEFKACPFCIKVRRTLQRLNLPIELKDAKNNPEDRKALEVGGGRIKVPCLRIKSANESEQWMYESNDIIAYLEKRFPVS